MQEQKKEKSAYFLGYSIILQYLCIVYIIYRYESIDSQYE